MKTKILIGLLVIIVFISGCAEKIDDNLEGPSRGTPTEPPKKCANEGDFCGGIAGIMCCEGLTCQLDGDYPDAGGTCIKGATKKKY